MSQKKEQTYEKAVERLEQIARLLQDDKQGIEESMELFKESIELSSFCYKKLTEYETQIKVLTEDGESELKL